MILLLEILTSTKYLSVLCCPCNSLTTFRCLFLFYLSEYLDLPFLNSKWPISSWIQDLNLNLFYVWKVKLLVFLNVILIPTPFLQNTGSSYKGINSGLTTYFFGENKEGNLTVDKFLEFQRQLQNEILRLEFNRKSSGSNTIPEKAFVELLIAYAGFPGIFTNFLNDFFF